MLNLKLLWDKQLEYEFDFSTKLLSDLRSNGIMKTSFTKFFQL
jgi:hypothetical protein